MGDAAMEMTDREAQARRQVIAAELAGMGFCLPGSFVEQRRTCSSPGCHCHDDPSSRHGPYRLWTRKVAGKTLTRILSEDQFERYRGWIDNARRLHELVAELEQLSVTTMARAEGWPDPPPPPSDRRRKRSPQVMSDRVGRTRAKAGKPTS
jgi:hypothetical protein